MCWYVSHAATVNLNILVRMRLRAIITLALSPAPRCAGESVYSSIAYLEYGGEQSFQCAGGRTRNNARLFLATFERDQGGTPGNFQLARNWRASKFVPIDADNFNFLILRVLFDERTHGAFLGSTGPSPTGLEVQNKRFATRKS